MSEIAIHCSPSFDHRASRSLESYCFARSAAEETSQMAIKVGINGFGRIGRNIMRAAMDDSEHRHRRGQRSDQRRYAGPSAQVRLDPRQPEGGHLGQGRPDHRRQGRVPGPVDEGSGAAAVEVARRRRRVRVDRPLHQPRRRGEAPRRRRQEGRHHRAGEEARTSRSSSASTRTSTIRRSTTSSRTRRARRTASRRSRRCCTRRSASARAG